MGSIAMTVVDEENYILDGVLYEFPQMEVPLDEMSAERAVMVYKQKMVDHGIAFGALDSIIKEDRHDDMPQELFADYVLQDPIDAAQALQWEDVSDNEEILSPNNAAFRILDIMFDPDQRNIVGRIHVLDTPQGNIMKQNIDANMRCMITQASVDEVVDRDRKVVNAWVMRHIVRKVRGGWRVSFEQNETVPSTQRT